MSNDGKPSDNSQTCMRISITIAPAENIAGDIAGLVGNFAFDLCQVVELSRQTSSKVNVQLIEMVTDALEHREASPDELNVEFSMLGDEVEMDVRTAQPPSSEPSTDAWFPPDAFLSSKERLAKTVRERRVDRSAGGLGLMRLRSGTKKKPSGSSGGTSGAPALLDFVPLRKKT